MTFCLTCQYDTNHLPNGKCSGCGNVNDYPASLKEAVEKYRGLGLSVIPNKPISKRPDLVEYKPYYQKYCDVDPEPYGNVGIMTGMGDGSPLGIAALPSTTWMLSTMNQADDVMVVDASPTPALFTFRDADSMQIVSGPTIGIQPLAGVDWFFTPDDGTGQPRYYLSSFSGGDGRRLPFGLL